MVTVTAVVAGSVVLLAAFGTGVLYGWIRLGAERQDIATALYAEGLERAEVAQRVLDYYDPPTPGWRKDGVRPERVEYDGPHQLGNKPLKGEE